VSDWVVCLLFGGGALAVFAMALHFGVSDDHKVDGWRRRQQRDEELRELVRRAEKRERRR